MAELALFLGKGGVGKTTVSAAYAVQRALQRKKAVLLISTDPAHSLSDILQFKLGEAPRSVPIARARGRLWAWQVNPEKQFGTFLGKYKDALLATIVQGTIFTRGEIEPLLDTALPGMAEMASLLAMEQSLASGRYDEIVVDTAPLGHTLRLVELPEHFSRFLDFVEIAGTRDAVLAAHFGTKTQPPAEFIAEWRGIVDSVRQALRDARLLLVTTSEKFSLHESVRCAEALKHSPLQLNIGAVVLNRAVRRASRSCLFCRQRAADSKAAQSFLKIEFGSAQVHLGEDSGAPILGVTNLQAFAQHVFEGKGLVIRASAPRAPEPRLRECEWPTLQNRLTMVIGKGGVGKTTISAGLASRAREAGRQVAICSVDPAPSLDDIFQTQVGEVPTAVLGDSGLQASEMDAAAEFAKWVSAARHKIDTALTAGGSGVHVDLSFERRLFSALLDVVPPGVDEIFAVFRIVDLLAGRVQRVVIDMAPTGHALELLRTPHRMLVWSRLLLKTLAAHRKLALARDVGVQIAEVGQQVRELLRWLKDPSRAKVWTVMLPEPLPDRETERLVRELEELQVAKGPLVINRVLFAEDVKGCERCQQSRRWQLATIARVLRQHSGEIYVARNFPSEIAGKAALHAFTRDLWRVV